ncbi:MAG TPA: large conductance mechanosensitive channel protein MscL [Thermoanaerobaculia bacterium]|nr:large conductance mechanosensitive channel protein MscL [Thermoanaerobaculia bacterium]
MLKGFRDFIARGNVVDLAVGVVIGVAFSGIVDSLVKDIITPIIGMVGGQPDFSAIKIGSVGIGNFINAVVAFLIKAAGIYFLIVLPFGRFAAKLAAAPPPTPQEQLLKEIRDLLKQQVQASRK